MAIYFIPILFTIIDVWQHILAPDTVYVATSFIFLFDDINRAKFCLIKPTGAPVKDALRKKTDYVDYLLTSVVHLIIPQLNTKCGAFSCLPYFGASLPSIFFLLKLSETFQMKWDRSIVDDI